MKIALCTTCMGRLPHLESTLTINVACLQSERQIGAELHFVALAFGDPATLSWLKWFRRTLPDEWAARLHVYYAHGERHWDVARAKNLAHCAALARHGTDVLVNVDADNYVSSRYLMAAAGVFAAGPGRYYGTTMDRAASPGRVACHAADFVRVGGYDEGPGLAWWGDDSDLMGRLAVAGCYAALLPVDPHVRHGDDLRLANAPRESPTMTGDAGRLARMAAAGELRRGGADVANAGRAWAATTLYDADGYAVSVAQGPTPEAARA